MNIKRIPVKAARGYWADDLNADNNARLLQTLMNSLYEDIDDQKIGDVVVNIGDGTGSIYRLSDYEYDFHVYLSKGNRMIRLITVHSKPDHSAGRQAKFRCTVEDSDRRVIDEFYIPMSGSRQKLKDKIAEIAESINGEVKSSMKITCKPVMADTLADGRQVSEGSLHLDVIEKKLSDMIGKPVSQAANFLAKYGFDNTELNGQDGYRKTSGIDSYDTWAGYENNDGYYVKLYYTMERDRKRGGDAFAWGILTDFYVDKYDVEASTRTAKTPIKAAYGGWSKFYGLPDVEFTVPNDTDDPTIFYNGKYYNYYDIEDTLWSLFKGYSEETGVIQDDEMFEQFVSENPEYVYEALENATPKAKPGRGVYRPESGMLVESATDIKAARGYNDDTVYVIFRKVRVDGGWTPAAFWYSSGQTLNYGKLYVIEPEFGGYICEEADMSYYNASKKLTPTDPGYADLKEYAYDWLTDHGDGQGGFKRIVEKQRLDYNTLRTSWYRDTIPDDDSAEYSVHSSTTARKRPIKAAATGHDPWSLIEQDRAKVIKEWSETYDGTPNTSWDNIFDNVLEDFKLYADDEASGNILDDFIESDFDEYDMLNEFEQFIMWRDLKDYDI